MPTRVWVWGILGALAGGATQAATICYTACDSLDGWSVHVLADATSRLVRDPLTGPCVQLASRGGTVLLSRELPLTAVRGCRVSVSCLVKTEGVVQGPQLVSAAKLHLAVETPTGVKHSSARFTGTREWQREGFTADVPADAQRAVLNVGLEACAGQMRVAGLLVRNDQRGVRPLPLAAVANAVHGQLGLPALPSGRIEWNGIPFEILDAARNESGDCLRLAGAGREDWPRATAAPIPVATGATAIYILHATLGDAAPPAGASDTPCAIWTAKYVGGYEASLSVFEGREIGRVGQTGEDMANWQVAWTGPEEAGRRTTWGVTKWTLYNDAIVESVSCRAYRGSPSVVLALTAVEEPAQLREPGGELLDDEVEGEGGE